MWKVFRIAITPYGRDRWFLIIHYEVITIIPFGHDRWFTSDVREALYVECGYPVGQGIVYRELNLKRHVQKSATF